MPNENAEGAQGKAEDAQELSAERESADAGAEPDGAGAEDAQDAGSGNGSEDEPEDKHGQPGINREKYKRDIAERDAKIAELSAKVDEAAKSADAREKLKQEIEDLLLTEALNDSIDRLEREFGILKDVEGFRVGKLETVSLEELEGELGFVD